MTRPPEPTPEEERYLRVRVKEELRTRMRALRKALPREVRAAKAALVRDRVIALPEFAAARVVSSFLAVRGEIDPAPIAEAALAAGKTVVLPRVDYEENGLVLHRWQPGDALEESGFGVPEPLPEAPRVVPDEVDFVIVPALAIDERGHRVGYGKGFYDRLLPQMPSAVRCAIAYDFQLLAEVPDIEGDVPVQIVVTEKTVLRV